MCGLTGEFILSVKNKSKGLPPFSIAFLHSALEMQQWHMGGTSFSADFPAGGRCENAFCCCQVYCDVTWVLKDSWIKHHCLQMYSTLGSLLADCSGSAEAEEPLTELFSPFLRWVCAHWGRSRAAQACGGAMNYEHTCCSIPHATLGKQTCTFRMLCTWTHERCCHLCSFLFSSIINIQTCASHRTVHLFFSPTHNHLSQSDRVFTMPKNNLFLPLPSPSLPPPFLFIPAPPSYFTQSFSLPSVLLFLPSYCVSAGLARPTLRYCCWSLFYLCPLLFDLALHTQFRCIVVMPSHFASSISVTLSQFHRVVVSLVCIFMMLINEAVGRVAPKVWPLEW